MLNFFFLDFDYNFIILVKKFKKSIDHIEEFLYIRFYNIIIICC